MAMTKTFPTATAPAAKTAKTKPAAKRSVTLPRSNWRTLMA